MKMFYQILILLLLNFGALLAHEQWEHYLLDIKTGGGSLQVQKVIAFDSSNNIIWSVAHSIDITTKSVDAYRNSSTMRPDLLSIDDTGKIWTSGVWSGVKSYYNGVEDTYHWDTTNAGVSQVIQDHNGLLWYNLVFGVGVFTFDGIIHKKISSFDTQIIRTDRDGAIWLVNRYEIHHYLDSTWEIIKIPHLISKEYGVSDLVIEKDGTIWISTYGFSQDRDSIGGLLCRDTNGSWKHFTIKDGLSHNYCKSLALDHEENLWIGSLGGLTQYDGKIFISWRAEAWGIDTTDLYQGNLVNDLVVDTDDNIWIATNGVHCLKRDNVTNVVMKQGGKISSSKTIKVINRTIIVAISDVRPQQISIQLFTINGKKVLELNNKALEGKVAQFEINNGIATGVYLLHITTPHENITTMINLY